MSSEYFSNAWNAYKKNLPVFVFAILIIGIIATIITGAFAVPLAQYAQANEVALTELGAILQNQQDLPSEAALEPYFNVMGGFAMNALWILLGVLIAGVLIFPLKVGLTKLYHEALKGEKVKLGTMFSYAKEKFRSSIGAVFLLYLIGLTTLIVSTALVVVFAYLNIISLLFAVIVFIVIGVCLVRLFVSLTAQALAVSKADAPNSISLSFNTVKKHFIEIVGLVIIFFIVTILINQFSRIQILDSVVMLILGFIVGPIKGLVFTNYYMKHNEKKKVVKKVVKKTTAKTPAKKTVSASKKPKTKK